MVKFACTKCARRTGGVLWQSAGLSYYVSSYSLCIPHHILCPRPLRLSQWRLMGYCPFHKTKLSVESIPIIPPWITPHQLNFICTQVPIAWTRSKDAFSHAWSICTDTWLSIERLAHNNLSPSLFQGTFSFSPPLSLSLSLFSFFFSFPLSACCSLCTVQKSQ